MRQFIDVLLDGVSIRDNIISLALDRRKNQAVDTLTLELADFSLYASFDFGLVPTTERLHVGTAKGTPKTDGSAVATGVLTSASSDFTAEGFAVDDMIHVIAAPSSLLTSLVASWKLGEAVGKQRIDSVGSNHLVDNDGVTQVAGKIGNAARFIAASSQCLDVDDNTDLSTGDIDFTWAGWIYLDTKTANMGFYGRWNPSNQREYILEYVLGSDRLRFSVSDDGTAGGATYRTAASFGSPPTDTWIFVVMWHDATANTTNIQVNNGTVDSTAHTTGVFDGTGPFKIGSMAGGDYLDGRVDALNFWKRILTTAERTDIYNAGSGKEHPFTTADVGGWPVTAVGTTTITTSHTFKTVTGMEFIILTNQGKFFGEKPDVLEEKNGISIPSLWGRNSLAKLTDPFVSKLTKTYTEKTTLTAVVLDLVSDAGMDSSKVVIDVDDYIIPGNLLSISQRIPLQVIIELAAKTNGYVRSTKAGDLHIRKDTFHWGSESIAQALTDNEVHEMIETVDFPEFGNRILVRSVLPESGQDIKLTLSIETSCIRGDGRAQAIATVAITDLRGNPVANDTLVNWSTSDTSLFALARQKLTFSKVVTGEEKRSTSLLTVSTDLPIVDVMGVFLKQDTRKLTNFYTGGTFLGRVVTLNTMLPFSNSEVVVDYVAGGISTNVIQSIAGAEEGAFAYINASIGQIRDSRRLCINNSRNVALRLRTDPSEHNLCLPGAHQSTIIASVRDNGGEGQAIGINWTEVGPGALSKAFTMVKNQTISSEIAISENFFTVNTQYDIVSVIGVWHADVGKSGTNLYTTPTHRTGAFDTRQILLGTDLPDQRERVIIEYVAKSVAIITYIGPTTGTGPDLSVITARIEDGTELGVEAEETILLVYRCPDPDTGLIPGVDPNTGLPSGPQQGQAGAGGPDCGASSTEARACDFSAFGLNEQVECICGFLAGGGCPTTEGECRTMCQDDYNKNGFSSLHCETETAKEFCGRETGTFSGASFNECSGDHEVSTVDKCTDRCMNHSGGGGGPFTVSPDEGAMDCGGVSEEIEFTAVGGVPPYSWQTTVGVVTVSGEDGVNMTLTPTPPTNNFPSQTAYIRAQCYTQPDAGCESDTRHYIETKSAECDGLEGAAVPCASQCDTPPQCNMGASCPCSPGCVCGTTCDLRTAEMEADEGCIPCALAFEDGAVVTVTDAFGNEALAVVT